MGDVLKIRDEYRQIQRAAAIQECKASGLTNKEYCIQHGLSEKSFYYWKKSKRSIITRPRQKNGLLQNSFLQHSKADRGIFPGLPVDNFFIFYGYEAFFSE